MSRFKNIFFSYSLQGLFRYFSLVISGKEYLLSGGCNGCGNCCRKIHLKTNQGWIRKEEHFLNMIKTHTEFQRFKCVGTDNQGFLQFSCQWLLPSGLCKDHENRLEICQKYPSKSLMFCGGHIPQECGYRIERGVPFKKVLEQESSRYNESKKNSHR